MKTKIILIASVLKNKFAVCSLQFAICIFLLKPIVFLLIVFLPIFSFAQNVGINTTGNAPNSSAMLDINASPGNDKGILIPRLPLTATNSGTPISPAPGVAETGLMVYNTATAGVSPNDVVPGFYFWNGTAWAPLGGGGSTSGGWTDDGTVVRLTASTDFVGIGTANPASTSALDITSTTKGILIPRMTTPQRDAITTPATGLQVYNLDCKVLEYWSGSCWISMSKAINDPDAISSSGTTVFCAGQVRTYTIAAVTGATYYNWTVPAGTVITSGQGTTSISATFGNISGNVCVKARNACETSGQTCLAVSVDPIPSTPGNITGPSSINPGQQSVNYFIASVNGASAYTWAYSGSGLTIASGTGTTSIVVNFTCNATAGNLTVTANSTCGASTASSLALTITPVIAVNAGAAKFGGATIGGTATAGNGTYNYLWSPTTNLSSSTVAVPTALCTGSTTTYTVTATDGNGCTATSSVVVTRGLAVNAGAVKFGGTTIGGTATGGNPTYTYLWSPTTDLSSSTVAVPTALCTGATTTYTVTVTDANSCTATSSVVVTRNLTASAGANISTLCPSIPTAIGGSPTATGGNATYTYLWSPITGLSSTTVANPTATVASTTSYTVTVTDANACTATASMTLTIGGGTPLTIAYSGASTTWTVPPGVTCIKIEAWGAEGGKGYNAAQLANTGLGGYVYGNKTVTPGDVLNIYVGQKGGDAVNGVGGNGVGGWNGGGTGAYGDSWTGIYNGGGGGGATDVRLGGSALTNRIIVGGAGAGGSYYVNSVGGIGAYSVGGNGTRSGATDASCGSGGTQSAGGAGAAGATSGGLGTGGAAQATGSCAGGGGAGYYGGGGGNTCNGGGGGGGSSYYGGMTSGTGNTNGNRSGNGQVIITY